MKYCWIRFVVFVIFYDELKEVLGARHQLCPAISMENGYGRRRSRGRMIKFICNRTYLLAGERHSTCYQGKWDPPPPKCVRPTCKPITSLMNSDRVLIYPTHNGAVQHFFCKPGYVLKGPSDIFCDGVKWDNNAPTCQAVNTKPKLFCDFEDKDLCGWTHDLNHDFDWKRENYGTPSGSIGTGPTSDHTKGVGEDGYYMYIESSAKNENDTARLISPIYDKTDQEVCLEFFYHMFGSTIGSLRVYLKKAKDKWTLNPSQAVFSKSGNQGDKWYRGYERLGVIDDEYQIIFEGVRGSGYVSDIAIDDIKIITNCTEEENYVTQSETPNTDIIPTIDSCENRCGQMEAETTDIYHLTCDCDDDCIYKSRCCPDFIDFCVFGSTSSYNDSTTTDTSNMTNVDENATTEMHLTIAVTTPTTKRALTTKTPMPSRIFTKPAPHFKTLKPVTHLPATQKTSSRPTIFIQSPPTTQKILRKTIPTTTRKPTTRIHTETKPVIPHIEIDSNDVNDVPRPTNNDEGLLLTPALPEDSSSKEYWSDETENALDTDTTILRNNFSESGKLLFSQKDSDSSNTDIFLVVVVSVTGVAVFISVVVFIVVRRYRFPRNRMHFSNGESQSDVRFLTSDEIIDFSLSDCYDE